MSWAFGLTGTKETVKATVADFHSAHPEQFPKAAADTVTAAIDALEGEPLISGSTNGHIGSGTQTINVSLTAVATA